MEKQGCSLKVILVSGMVENKIERAITPAQLVEVYILG